MDSCCVEAKERDRELRVDGVAFCVSPLTPTPPCHGNPSLVSLVDEDFDPLLLRRVGRCALAGHHPSRQHVN
jgi:hypothetical protein